MSQQFCLKWNNHMNNMMDVFKNLLSTESMVDVTLACDGLSLKAHKMVLSACSPFFQALFLENPCQHPIVILKDMKYTELKAIIEFMYHGEVNVAQDQLSALMKTAETLRVKGLAEVTNEKSQSASQDDSRQSRSDTPPPHSKRRKVRNRKRSLSGSDYSDSEREPKIKQSASPDIEELSGDISLDNTSSGQFSNVQQTRVPMQSHSSNSYHKTSSVASSQDLHMEGTSENESEFGVEPAKLLQQSLTTEDARRNRLSTLSTSSEPQRRPKSSTDHSMGMSIVPTPLPSDDNSQQQPLSPPDIKPELLELDPPMSPVAGTSHGSENAMVVYGDPGPSSYQDNSALVPQDSQQQDEYITPTPIRIGDCSSIMPTSMYQAQEPQTPFDITPYLYEPWPRNFTLPVEHFSDELIFSLNVGVLPWRCKNELLGHISREIQRYTLKPSVQQRDQVAKELVSLYPSLKSNIGEGHHAWSQKIYDKMCEVSKRFGSSKRSSVTKGLKTVKLPRRGEVNFFPNRNVPENEISASKNFLAEESKKPVSERNKEGITEHMSLTFCDRRMLIAQKCLFNDLKKEYSILFSEQGILHDFQLINGFNLEQRFHERLKFCANTIKGEGLLLTKKCSSMHDLLIKCFDASNSDDESSITAIRLLPHLLGDKDSSYLYKNYSLETKINVVKDSGPKTPHVAVLGKIDNSCLCYVVVEQDDVISVRGFLKAIMLMFGVYYCCNIEYAPEVSRTLKFIQTYILQMPESKKLPSKLITFCSKMP